LVDISAFLVLRDLLLDSLSDRLLLSLALLLQLALLIGLLAENFFALKFLDLFFPLEMSFLHLAGLLLHKLFALALFLLFFFESPSASNLSLLLLLPLDSGLFLSLSIIEFLELGFFLAQSFFNLFHLLLVSSLFFSSLCVGTSLGLSCRLRFCCLGLGGGFRFGFCSGNGLGL
jgi:hypothetical protein